jgi:hypothetical protein
MVYFIKKSTMFRIVLFLICCCTNQLIAQISVHSNQRSLTHQNGQPFFWLGDTDWELFHRLNREEAVTFLSVRSSQGFNVLQAVALAEFNGIRQPNRYGDLPLINEDPSKLAITGGNDPNDSVQYDYWDHVDFIIKEAASRNMYIGLLPTWGDKVTLMWGEGPVIFNEKNAQQYAELLAKRYKDQWNVIWILGGDRPAVYERDGKKYDDRNIWRAMARGIRNVMGDDVFITYHTSGGEFRTSDFLQDEDWLSMHSFQSGHGARDTDPWRWVMEDLSMKPLRPTMDMEPCYEDHPVNPWDGKWTRNSRGYFTDYDVRARIYRGVFAGGCGVTYGHHQVWQFLDTALYPPINIGDTIIGWRKAMLSEGATQMQHVKNLMLSRPYFSRMADQSIIQSDRGSDYRDLLYATMDSAGTYAMIYLPQNKPVSVDLSRITGISKNVSWFDPRTGRTVDLKRIKAKGIRTFTPPKEGQDWVLIIDDASRDFPLAGVPYKN